MKRKSKNYKFIAGTAVILSLIIAIVYYFAAETSDDWQRWLPVGLFVLVAIVAFIRYRKL